MEYTANQNPRYPSTNKRYPDIKERKPGQNERYPDIKERKPDQNKRYPDSYERPHEVFSPSDQTGYKSGIVKKFIKNVSSSISH